MHTIIGEIIKFTLISQSMKMETQKKNHVQSTHITLKECLNDPEWLKGLELIQRDTKTRLENSWYETENTKDEE